MSGNKETVSIIIPTFNEEEGIARTLDTLIGLMGSDWQRKADIIVCDAGTDRTAEIAAEFPLTVCRSQKGRSVQMNKGASLAGGSILYFLHADTTPPPSFLDHITQAVRSGSHAGCFQMKFDDPDWIMSLYGWFTRVPLMLCRGGDQSLYVTRALFGTVGGFNAEMQIMEDIDIIERLERHCPFRILEPEVTTSARKYHANGRLELQAVFGMLHLMYACGSSQEDLTRFYKSIVR